MRPIVTDQVTWSVGLSVGLSVTLVNPAKTAEPIEMLSGDSGAPRNHVLDGGVTVAQRGKYDGTVHMRRRCGLIGSRPSDHYFRSVCLFVCLFVQSFSQPSSIRFGSN